MTRKQQTKLVEEALSSLNDHEATYREILKIEKPGFDAMIERSRLDHLYKSLRATLEDLSKA